MNKIIFWNVNTQEDFFNEGPMKMPNSESIRPKLRALTDFAKQNKIKVVNVVSWNEPKAKWLSDSADYVKTFPPHCIMNSNGTNFITETIPDNDVFMVKGDSPYIVFPEIHKHRNIVIFKNELNLIEGNKFADSVLNNLGTVLMSRPDYVVYGIGAGLVARDLTLRGYSVKILTDATIEFQNIPIDYDEINVEEITTDMILSVEIE